jgi:hypothetical protein
MQQVADWLEKLGLSEYAQRFAENGIDASVLRYLTDQDLPGTVAADVRARAVAIQMRIGQAMRQQYGVPEELPDQLFTLLMQATGLQEN